jgi:2'-5' RNA ligase
MKQLYFTALVLPDELNAEIAVFKQRMLNDFGCRISLRSPAHITLLPPFRMDAPDETALVEALDTCCALLAPFRVETAGFGAFPPRTLFIEPVLTADLKTVRNAMADFARAYPTFGAVADARPFHPHITIATRDLTREAFEAAWANWGALPFVRRWEATGVETLRMGQKKWEVIHTSPFRS